MENKEILNRVLHGSCFEWLPQIEDKSIDMILCDLPYGTTQNKWDSVLPLDLLWKEYERIIKVNGAIVLFSAEPFTSQLINSNLKNFRYDLIWEKSHAVGFLNARRMPMRKHENICVFYKKLPTYNPQIEDKPVENIRPITTKNRLTSNYGSFDEGNHRTIPVDKTYPKSILKISNESKTETKHPTQKPVKLCEWLINTYTNESETILDNCLGSGTTAVACINTNRNFIGIEKEWDYCEVANGRIKKAKEAKVF
jgi:site-specific DNA-methyltransferase (adenine-specific)